MAKNSKRNGRGAGKTGSKPVPQSGFLRGLQNYGDPDFSIYMRRAFARSMGYSLDELKRPVVGIANTYSRFNPCHRHFPELVEAVKRGVSAAGGLPLEFPTISVHESTLAPNSMKFRNLMAMDTEEMIRAQPMDAVVMLGACDKTVPAQLMGAASAGKPAIQLIGGPQMTGRYKEHRVGACTDCRKFWTEFRAGRMPQADIEEVEGRLVTTAGSCAVMGTASTMAAIAEALGMTLPGTAAIPAVHADRIRAAEASGAAAVRMIGMGLTPDRIITQGSVENAARVLLALGGSTNGVIHLAAIAGRLGLKLDLERFNALSDTTPVLAAVKPVGNEFYMEDFHAAGGIGAVLRELAAAARPRLHDGHRRDARPALGGGAGGLGRPPGHPRSQRSLRSRGRAGGTVRVAGAGRGHHQALGGNQIAVREDRARHRVPIARGHGGAHRRSRARCHRGRFPRSAERRSALGSSDAGSRLPADPEEAAGARREGHGAHVGRAHVGHGLRHHRAAYCAGGGRRRPAGPGAHRRPHPSLGQASAGSIFWSRRPS